MADAQVAFLKVWENLGFFLETVDTCDLHYLDRTEDRLIFQITARREENLPLILTALGQERKLLDDLGIDPYDMRIEKGAILVTAALS